MVTFLGSLVQSCCGEGGTLGTSISGCACSVSATLGLPPLRACVPSQSICLGSRLLCRELRRALGCVHFPGLSRSCSGSRVLHRGADWVGPAFCALPRSEQLRRPGAWVAWSPPVEGCDLSPPPSLLLCFLGVQPAQLLKCAVCLFWGADPPSDPPSGCRPSRIPRSLG